MVSSYRAMQATVVWTDAELSSDTTPSSDDEPERTTPWDDRPDHEVASSFHWPR